MESETGEGFSLSEDETLDAYDAQATTAETSKKPCMY